MRARRAETALACELGRAVHHRRTELGLSQTALARRADMTQPQISTIEGGGTVPTLPILVRLARALEASLHLAIDDDAGSVTLVPRAAV